MPPLETARGTAIARGWLFLGETDMRRIELERTNIADDATVLALFKAHLRVSGTAEDTQIAGFLDRACRDLEDDITRLVVRGTVKEYFDVWPWTWYRWLRLAYAPVASVTSVKYYDADNVEQTWDAANYETELKGEPATIRVSPTATLATPNLYDRLDAVEIEYESGLSATAAGVDNQTLGALFVRGAWYYGPGRELMPEVSPEAFDRCWEHEVVRQRWTLGS